MNHDWSKTCMVQPGPLLLATYFLSSKWWPCDPALVNHMSEGISRGLLGNISLSDKMDRYLRRFSWVLLFFLSDIWRQRPDAWHWNMHLITDCPWGKSMTEDEDYVKDAEPRPNAALLLLLLLLFLDFNTVEPLNKLWNCLQLDFC